MKVGSELLFFTLMHCEFGTTACISLVIMGLCIHLETLSLPCFTASVTDLLIFTLKDAINSGFKYAGVRVCTSGYVLYSHSG